MVEGHGLELEAAGGVLAIDLGLNLRVRLAGADVVGCGIAIEKRYQHGGDALRAENIRVESLALIDSMENGNIVFSQI